MSLKGKSKKISEILQDWELGLIQNINVVPLEDAQNEIEKREQEFQEVQNDAYETINRLTEVNRKLEASNHV